MFPREPASTTERLSAKENKNELRPSGLISNLANGETLRIAVATVGMPDQVNW